ncbi:MAG: hypothetical protein ABSB41_03300 [Anaerolineales bacterium]
MDAGISLLGVAEDWQRLAALLETASVTEEQGGTLAQVSELLGRIADQEESVWRRLWASTS